MTKEKIITLVSRVFSIEQCRTNPGTLFIYGDNFERSGIGGQAVIRDQINSIGICTKLKPSRDYDAYFNDDDYENNCKIIDEDIKRVWNYVEEHAFKAIVLPKFGLGTGRSAMQSRCPKTFLYLCSKLLEEFEFNNVQFLESKNF